MIVSAILLILPTLTVAFPGGAPTKHCVDLVPTGHGTDALQSSAPEYKISVSSSSYRAGDKLTVTIEPLSSSSSMSYFKGIMLQARRASCLQNQNDTIGHFELPLEEVELKLVNCGGNATTVSHQKVAGVPGNGVPNKGIKNVTWIAPSSADGHIVFKATIVKQFSVIWLDVTSDVIRDESGTLLPSEEECSSPSNAVKLSFATALFFLLTVVVF